jgi:16S rRNA (adenine1518-N6/adenine1519-N6)-dimethyltransferase
MIEAKRSLGQNFFVNENLAKSIVESICQQKSDVIVEIGSGQGYFSSLFQKHGKKLIMIEKDNFLAKGLSEHYPEQEVVTKARKYSSLAHFHIMLAKGSSLRL